MVVNHPVDMQVFYTDDAKLIDDFPALLMSEVFPFPSNLLIDTSHCMTMLPPCECAFRQIGMLALDVRKSFLFNPKEVGMSNLLPIRKRGKGFQNAETRLGIGDAIIAPLAFTSRISRFFTRLATPKEGFISQIKAYRSICKSETGTLSTTAR